MELVFEHTDTPPPPVPPVPAAKKEKKPRRQDKRPRKKPNDNNNVETPQPPPPQRNKPKKDETPKRKTSTDSLKKNADEKKKEANINELIQSERSRIRQLEQEQVKGQRNGGPVDSQKPFKRSAKSSFSNQHVTRHEEHLLEHITAFMFDYEHSRVVPTQRDDDDGQEPEKDRTPTKSEINQLQSEHIGQTSSGQFYSHLALQVFPTVDAALRHCSGGLHGHKRARKDLKDQKAISSLSTKLPITSSRYELVNGELDQYFPEVDLAERERVFGEVKTLLCGEADIKMELYGSTLTGTCLPTSDINVQVYHAELRPNKLLSQLSSILTNLSDQFETITERFYPAQNTTGFTPHLVVVYQGHTLTIVAADAELTPRIRSSRLVKLYFDLEPRLRRAALVLRHWAHWTRMDKVDEGTIPAYAFVLMLITRAQQENWLPVLHELTECRLDELPVRRRDGKWWFRPRKQKVVVEEDVMVVDMANLVVSDEEEEETTEAVTTEDNAEADEEQLDELDDDEIELESMMESTVTPCHLLSSFFAYYGGAAGHFDMEHKVISLRVSHVMSRAEKGWGARRLAVEDPFMRKRNVCRSMCSQAAFDYMRNRMRISLMRMHIGTCEFDAIVETNQTRLNTPSSTSEVDKDGAPKKVPKVNKKSFLFGEINSILESRKPTKADKAKIDLEFGEYLKQANEGDDVDGEEQEEGDEQHEPLIILSNEELKQQLSRVFTESNIAGGLRPAKSCQLCRAQGHQAKSCPDSASQVTLPPLSPLTKGQIKLMDKVLRHIYESNCPTKQETKHREDALANLTQILRDEFSDGIQLVLFGSSRNGFGFKGSDMDLCLSFAESPLVPPPEHENSVDVIKSLAKIFKQRTEFTGVNAICAAKVPIVKFDYTFNGVTYEGDISYYNILAQRNTKLLHFYANFDKRCRILGYVLKSMAKLCGVADASRGSISSYGYTLLLIHYLQQVKVLPCLQELTLEGEEKPTMIVEQFDTWFQDDMNVIDQLFARDNKDSLAELWVGLLSYYTEQFQFDRNLVQIRKMASMTTFEKEWTSKCISIEDPFELSHNLGSGISRKMANFIVKMMQRSRNFFGTFNEHVFSEHNWQPDTKKMASAYFTSAILTDGEEVPNDRCCRTCGKIGHFSKDCPRSRKNIKKALKDPAYAQELGMKCFVCQQPGHMAKQCTQRRERPHWHHQNHHHHRDNNTNKRNNGNKWPSNNNNSRRYNRGGGQRGGAGGNNNEKADTEREIKKLIGITTTGQTENKQRSKFDSNKLRRNQPDQ